MTKNTRTKLPAYRKSLAGSLLAAREAVMAPIRPALRAANVTDQQWRVLRVLADEQPLDAQSLATSAMLHAPSVTRIIKDLAQRGLVDRRSDPTDGRRSLLVITKGGLDLVDATAAITVQVLENYAAAFGEERLESLRRELQSLNETIKRFAPED